MASWNARRRAECAYESIEKVNLIISELEERRTYLFTTLAPVKELRLQEFDDGEEVLNKSSVDKTSRLEDTNRNTGHAKPSAHQDT
jgi:hypothetical protein